jgi:MFS family permease
MIIGSALFTWCRRQSTTLLVGGSTALVGLGYVGLGLAPEIVTACLASAIGGIGNGIQWVSVLTAVQEAVERNFQARVVGLLESVGAAAPGVGYVLGGVLTSIWSPRIAYFVAGFGVLLVAAAMTRRLAAS